MQKKSKPMKRTFLIFALAIPVLACNSGSNQPQTAEAQNPNVTIVEEVEENEVSVETEVRAEAGKVIVLNNSEFRETVHDYKSSPQWEYKGELPCIVDFYADWCRPCREIAPILDELAKEYEGKINIYKVNSDFEGELTNFYGVQYLPTLMFCKTKGDPLKQVGAFSKADLKRMIENDLLN